MPALQAPAKVLVTGASGFLAAHVCRELLEHGFDVVGTVRSPSKGAYLKSLFDNFSPHFSYVVVEDIEKPGAFDEAVEGIDAVEHTASPFHLVAEDPQEIIGPAVKGTTGILDSILKHGHNVKRVIVTSSVAAIIEPKATGPYTFTEADWNTNSVEVVEKEGKNASGGQKYRASKTLAERSAWEFVQNHKDTANFDLATINPPFVFGPTIHEVQNVDAVNESVALFRQYIISPPSREVIAGSGGNYVDVRDAALAHVLALEIPEAGGERYIVSNGPYSIQDFYDTLRDAHVADVPVGYPGSQQDTVHDIHDGSKATRVLGLKYRSIQETAVDTVNSFRTRFPDAK